MIKSKKDYEKYLNDLYSEMDQFDAVDSLLYLTNKKRGRYISFSKLQSAHKNNRMGTILKLYDPIAFNAGYEDFKII